MPPTPPSGSPPRSPAGSPAVRGWGSTMRSTSPPGSAARRMAEGRVAEIWRYPVKSTRGERLERVRVEPDGLRGDRLLRVEAAGKLVTPRSRRGLLDIDATL